MDTAPNGTSHPLQARLLACVLDEVDHGLLLVNVNGQLLHANHPARRELASGHALCLTNGQLRAQDPLCQPRLRQALSDASRHCRSLIELDDAGEPLSLAFIPMGSDRPIGGAAGATSEAIDTALIICGRTSGCEALTLQMFARARQLTLAEQNVLGQLCAGHAAEDIAQRQGVCLSTVRTHIKNARQKTGSGNIRDMVRRVWCMPQIGNALRLTASE